MTNTLRKSFIIIYSIWDKKAYVCVFVSVFSALTIPWNRLELGVLLELSSYLDCVWCDFCTWGFSRLKCLPFVSNVISTTNVNPYKSPYTAWELYPFIGQQWFILYATYFKSRKWHLPLLSGPWWSWVLRNYVVAHNWLWYNGNRWNETNDVLMISISEIKLYST